MSKTEIKYGDYAKVVRGFYEGREGIVMAKSKFLFFPAEYLVGNDWINEKDIEILRRRK